MEASNRFEGTLTNRLSQLAINKAEIKAEDKAAVVPQGEVQGVAGEATATDFSGIMAKLLGKTGQEQVNEEELFSGLIEKFLTEASPDAGAFYKEQVRLLSASTARSDGYVYVEDVSKAALRATVAAGKIEESAAKLVHEKAFIAAQLDNIKEALYDGRGSSEDTTIAVSSMEEAMTKVRLILDEIESGKVKLSGRDLNIASNRGPWGVLDAIGRPIEGPYSGEGEAIDGAEGIEGEEESKALKFSWKHIARDGNLAVLVPQPLSDNIDSVVILDSDGNEIERGHYSKTTGDNRAVYRFDQPGGDYGKDLKVVISKENGDTITYKIPDGNKRTSEWLSGDPDDRIDKKAEEKAEEKESKSERA